MRITKSEIRSFRSLSQKKIREQDQKFVLEGWRAIKEGLNSSTKLEIVAVLSRYIKDADYARIIAALENRGVTVKEVIESELDQIADTVHSQGVVAIAHQKKYSIDQVLSEERVALVVAADGVSDPGNLGSIVRSADWFDVDLLLLGRGCVDLYNEKVVRSTVGSILHLPIVVGVDLPQVLGKFKESGFGVVAFSGEGKMNYTERPSYEIEVFVFGNEAHGISPQVRKVVEHVVRIPRYGKAESLNVGVACGIVLANARAQEDRKKG